MGGAVDVERARRTPATLVYEDGGTARRRSCRRGPRSGGSHEGAAVAEVVSRQGFDYDAFGNVTTFDDLGDVADPSRLQPPG
jgi:hypothetical protein